MNENQPAIRFAALAALPVIVAHSCLAPFWLAEAFATSGGGWLPFAAILLTSLAAPIYLTVLGCRLILRRIPVFVPFGLSVIVSVLALNFFLDYSLWGAASGHFATPDEGTVEVMRFEAVVASAVFALPLIITLIARYGFQHFTRNA